jgi:hypothetical protein
VTQLPPRAEQHEYSTVIGHCQLDPTTTGALRSSSGLPLQSRALMNAIMVSIRAFMAQLSKHRDLKSNPSVE